MRAKKAKALRRAARLVSQGLPERQLIWNSEKKQFAINNPQSTRAIYRRWKKLAVKGRAVFVDA